MLDTFYRPTLKLLREHVGIVLSAALFLAMAIRLMAQARLDAATLSVLLQSGDIFEILFVALVDLTPMVLLAMAWLPLVLCLLDAVTLPRVALIIISLLMLSVVVPWWLGSLYLVLLVAGGWFVGWLNTHKGSRLEEKVLGRPGTVARAEVERLSEDIKRLSARATSMQDEVDGTELLHDMERHVAATKDLDRMIEESKTGVIGALLIFLAVLMLILVVSLLQGTIWLPAERVTLDTGEVRTVHVVKADDGWLRLVGVKDRSIVTVTTEALESREVCLPRPGPRFLARPSDSLAALLLSAEGPRHPACD